VISPLTTRSFGRLFKEAAKPRRWQDGRAGIRFATALRHLLERGETFGDSSVVGHSKPETQPAISRAIGLIAKIESPLEGLRAPRRRRRSETVRSPAHSDAAHARPALESRHSATMVCWREGPTAGM